MGPSPPNDASLTRAACDMNCHRVTELPQREHFCRMADIASSYSYSRSVVPLPPPHNILCVFVLLPKSAGLAAPILAEVLFDKGGPVAPLLVFGPTMIITGIFAGEGLILASATEKDSLCPYDGGDWKRAFATQPMIPRTDSHSSRRMTPISNLELFIVALVLRCLLSPTYCAAACCRRT